MKNKIKFDQPHDEIKIDVPTRSGGFLGGLAIGALAGATGFFLYGTKKGRVIKNNLMKEINKLSGELKEMKKGCCSEEPKKLPAKTSKATKKPSKKNR